MPMIRSKSFAVACKPGAKVFVLCDREEDIAVASVLDLVERALLKFLLASDATNHGGGKKSHMARE
jgi:hypothetical protein